jgi:hypothetical protein
MIGHPTADRMPNSRIMSPIVPRTSAKLSMRMGWPVRNTTSDMLCGSIG